MGGPIGSKRWAIAEGYIPAWSHGPASQLISHETVCLLNASERDAHVEITIFFSDREPAGPYLITVPARRARHVRFFPGFARRSPRAPAKPISRRAHLETGHGPRSANPEFRSGQTILCC